MNMKQAYRALKSLSFAILLALPCRASDPSEIVGDDQLQAIAKPQQLVVMHFTKEGIIAKVSVKEGDVVEVGQSLVSLDDRGARAAAHAAALQANHFAEATMAKIAMEQKKTILNRVREAMATNASSAYELESKQAEYDQAVAFYDSKKELQERAKAEAEIAQVELEKHSLAAPIRGVVLQLHSKLGNSINPTMPIVTVANLDTLELEMHLPTSMFGKIQSGRSYKVACSAPVSTQLDATAMFVSPVLDATSETFRVVFVIDNKVRRLPAGFTAWLSPEGVNQVASK